MVSRMREAHQLLEPVMGDPVRFYTFSLAEDSPADMKAAMRARGIDGLRGWTMLTASREIVRDIRWAFGFFEPNEELDQRLDGHTGMARFGNHASDKWSACPALGSPKSIATSLLGVVAHEDRQRVRWFAEERSRHGRPIPGWKDERKAI
jgi:protein SCO1/2